MTRRALARSCPSALAAVALAAFLGCAGGPSSREGTPPTTPAGGEATSTAESVSGASGTTADNAAAGSRTEAAAASGGTEGGSSDVAQASPTPAGGTRIVVPTARERAITRAVAGAQDALAGADADALLKAGQALVESEAVASPEGGRLAARVLARFRDLSPGRIAELVPVIERAHVLAAGTAASFAALGWGHLARGDVGPAEAAAVAGLLLAPMDTDLLLLRARLLVATDRWFQAQRPLETLLRAEPNNADGLLLRATILWQYERDGRAAIEAIQNAFAVHPEDLRFPELQGRILYEQGQRAEARLVLNALLARDPSRQDIARFLLDDAVGRAAWNEATTLLARLPPPAGESELLTAHAVASGSGDSARAVELAAKLDALVPDRRFAPLAVRSLLAAGQTARAVAAIGAALEASRDGKVRSELFYLRAAASGEPFSEDAVRDIRRALAENPGSADAMFAMARHYAATGQTRQALQYARSALRERPDDAAIAGLLRKIEERPAPP